MIERIRKIIRSENSCVLATTCEDTPLCSLMFYTANDDCTEIYFLSSTETEKAKNISANSTISLLIDTRNNHSKDDFSRACAVTVSGRCDQIDDSESSVLKNKFCISHPYMKEFASKPETCVFRVRPNSFLLLDGPFESFFQLI